MKRVLVVVVEMMVVRVERRLRSVNVEVTVRVRKTVVRSVKTEVEVMERISVSI